MATRKKKTVPVNTRTIHLVCAIARVTERVARRVLVLRAPSDSYRANRAIADAMKRIADDVTLLSIVEGEAA